MDKKSGGLLYKFGIIFSIFTVVVLTLGGLATYIFQVATYKKQCETNVQNLCEYLKVLIRQDGMDFVHYQDYYLENYERINIPYDFDGNYIPAMEAYDTIMEEQYPGMVIDKDIAFDDLSDEAKMAFEIYTHEYWLYVFEAAKETFGVKYAYYITPGDDPYHMHYVIDGVRREKEVGGEKYIELGIYKEEPLQDHPVMWQAWEKGETPQGYDIGDNEYGKTYAYYSPLIINGKKLGIIAVDLEIASVDKEILSNTVLQVIGVAIFLILCVIILMVVLNKHYIRKLQRLVNAVKQYTLKKDPQIARIIEAEAGSGDEISSLAIHTAAMIRELDSYITNLIKTKEELTEIRFHANELKAKASTDPLTGVRFKAAYDEALRRIEWDFARGDNNFGFAIVNINLLKMLNEKYGVEKGNIALKKICAIVCNVFEHFPVFRGDGDEFIVVLRDIDFYDAHTLVQRFKDEVERYCTNRAMEPWERVTAAIGYAVYDPIKDSSVADVFKRARDEMFKDKQDQKAARD